MQVWPWLLLSQRYFLALFLTAPYVGKQSWKLRTVQTWSSTALLGAAPLSKQPSRGAQGASEALPLVLLTSRGVREWISWGEVGAWERCCFCLRGDSGLC